MLDKRETKTEIFVKKLFLKIDLKHFTQLCVYVHVCACICMFVCVACRLQGAWCE